MYLPDNYLQQILFPVSETVILIRSYIFYRFYDVSVMYCLGTRLLRVQNTS